jgi:hypothetical protein
MSASALFDEAIAALSERQVVGSVLRSAEWRDKVAVGLRDKAFFSARVENARVLQTMQDYLLDYLGKAIDPETGGLRAQGRAEFVADMRELCIREGIGKVDPETGEIAEEIDESDLTDLRSTARLQLIFDTQVEQANEYGYWSQGNDPDVLAAFPAQRFIRVRPVRVPRAIHAAAEGTVRRKDDIDFWIGLNPDFGVPWGPWGFNSGMGVEDVDRIEAEDLGIIAPGDKLASPEREMNDRLSASVRDMSPDLVSELSSVFGSQVTIKGGRMEWLGKGKTAAPAAAPLAKTVDDILKAVASAATREEAHAALELDAADRGSLAMSAKPTGVIKPHAKAGIAFIERMVHRDHLPATPLAIVRDKKKNARGFYWQNTAHIRKDDGNAVHEIAHHLEWETPLYEEAKKFRKSRTQGETAQKLSALTGQAEYKDDEVAFEDQWAARGGDHYMGKSYKKWGWKATEIITMGMERLHNDPVGFAKDDPEYFRFLINIIQKR